ncbi:unnamed protein product [Rhodiola kirilowii]
MAYDVLLEKGSDVTPYVKKLWEILSSVYIKEARWFHSGYKPSLDEYMSNAWISVGVPTAFLHVHLFDTSLLVNESFLSFITHSFSFFHPSVTKVFTCSRAASSEAPVSFI